MPLLVTGGIHIDGFSDTMDALSSHAERQKKLEIMDDPHIGAFGVHVDHRIYDDICSFIL